MKTLVALLCTVSIVISQVEKVEDHDLGKFIERQRKEIREISPRLTDKQRKVLLAHIEFYGDEVKSQSR